MIKSIQLWQSMQKSMLARIRLLAISFCASILSSAPVTAHAGFFGTIWDSLNWTDLLSKVWNAPVVNGLNGQFGCDNWQLTGTGDCSSSGLNLTSGDSGDFLNDISVPEEASWTLNYTGAPLQEGGTSVPIFVAFSWNYESFDRDGPAYDPARISRPINFDLSQSTGPAVQSGANTIPLSPGETISFTISTVDGWLGPASISFNSFSFKSAQPSLEIAIEGTKAALQIAADKLVPLAGKVLGAGSLFIDIPSSTQHCGPGTFCHMDIVEKWNTEQSDAAFEKFKDELEKKCIAATGSADCGYKPEDPRNLLITEPGVVLKENSPAHISFNVDFGALPEDGEVQIPFMPEVVGDGDVLSIWLDKKMLWGSFGMNLEAGELYIARIAAADLSEVRGELNVILLSTGAAQAQYYFPSIDKTGLFVFAPVPEPKSYLLIMAGLSLLSLVKRNVTRAGRTEVETAQHPLPANHSLS